MKKLLGVTIDHKINFSEYDKSLCTKTSQKLNTVADVLLYEITYPSKKIIFKLFNPISLLLIMPSCGVY